MATPYVEEGTDGLVFVDENGNRHPAYLMKQALEKADISESTFYRWIRSNRVPDVKLRNRANWRIFTDIDIEQLKKEASRSQGR
jgi:predicted DNA-binding transcriptional regulator AlpA